MLSRAVVLLLPISLWLASTDAATTPPIVDLGYAQYQPSIHPRSGNAQFLGMRYARAPVGDLRWRAPQSPSFEPGIQKADALPPNCPRGAMGIQPVNPYRSGFQAGFSSSSAVEGLGRTGVNRQTRRQGPPPVPSSEDCLFLNVFVPASRVDFITSADPKSDFTEISLLPVVVWIHGGGYIGGGIGNDGNDLIAFSKGGVVVVQMQYRIGVFGFLAGEEVKRDGVLNAGLLDQQFALQWVQRHIHKFGGDRRRVTIWGQSAGAGSVLQHLVANGGRTRPSLFRSAITSSTFVPSQYMYNSRIPEAVYNETVTRAGCHSSKSSLECLRKLGSEDLIALNIAVCTNGFYGTFTFGPVVDGTFVAQSPTQAIREGKVNTVNLLAVTNTYEGVGFVNASTTSTPADYISNLFPLLSGSAVAKAAELYSSLGSTIDQIGLIMGETIFVCPTYTLLEHLHNRRPNMVFKGHFAVPPARHAGDVAYYYPSNGLPAWPDPAFSEAFAGGFLDFVLSGGDLNVKINRSTSSLRPFWPPWQILTKEEMVFNRTDEFTSDIRTRETDAGLWKRCLFWQSLARDIGQ